MDTIREEGYSRMGEVKKALPGAPDLHCFPTSAAAPQPVSQATLEGPGGCGSHEAAVKGGRQEILLLQAKG